MDKKHAARGGSCFADCARRSCKCPPAFSCPLPPVLDRWNCDLAQPDTFSIPCRWRRSTIDALIFPQQFDRSWFQSAAHSKRDAHKNAEKKTTRRPRPSEQSLFESCHQRLRSLSIRSEAEKSFSVFPNRDLRLADKFLLFRAKACPERSRMGREISNYFRSIRSRFIT